MSSGSCEKVAPDCGPSGTAVLLLDQVKPADISAQATNLVLLKSIWKR